jgi:hypothetical protein
MTGGLDAANRLVARANIDSASYIQAAIEIIGSNARPPRVAFHNAGVAASQIGHLSGDGSGEISAMDGNGTGYMGFRALFYRIGGTAVIDSGRSAQLFNMVAEGGSFTRVGTAAGGNAHTHYQTVLAAERCEFGERPVHLALRG